MEYLSVLNVVLLLRDGKAFYRDPTSTLEFLRFCLSFIIGFGIVFLQLMDATVGYKFQVMDLDVIQGMYLTGYASLLIGSLAGALFLRLFPKRIVPIPFGAPEQVSPAAKTALYSLATLSVAAVMVYVAVTGLSFGSSSYESRYTDAQGMGILLRLFPAFLPFLTYRLCIAKTRAEYVRVSVVGLLYTAFMYIALDGYRQILIAAFCLTLLLGLKRGYFKGWVLIGCFVAMVPALVGLSFLRYSGDEGGATFTDPIIAALYYLQGDLFPIDAPLRTYWWCHYNECPGATPFMSHFLHLVPRFLWPEKPDILLDSAGYYTQVIVGYSRMVTLSSTILSEAIMIGGLGAVPLIFFFSGFLARAFTILTERANGALKFILLSNVWIGFFWIREGLENGLLRIFFAFVFFAMGVLIAAVFRSARTPSARRKVPSYARL